MTAKLGKDAVILWGAVDPADLAALVADETGGTLTGVADVSLSTPADEADVTTRASGGWKNTLPTLKACELTFDMPLDPADLGYLAIREAYTGGTQLGMWVGTGSAELDGNEGPLGNWSVTSLERAEPLGDKQMVSVTCKLAAFIEWAEGETP